MPPKKFTGANFRRDATYAPPEKVDSFVDAVFPRRTYYDAIGLPSTEQKSAQALVPAARQAEAIAVNKATELPDAMTWVDEISSVTSKVWPQIASTAEGYKNTLKDLGYPEELLLPATAPIFPPRQSVALKPVRRGHRMITSEGIEGVKKRVRDPAAPKKEKQPVKKEKKEKKEKREKKDKKERKELKEREKREKKERKAAKKRLRDEQANESASPVTDAAADASKTEEPKERAASVASSSTTSASSESSASSSSSSSSNNGEEEQQQALRRRTQRADDDDALESRNRALGEDDENPEEDDDDDADLCSIGGQMSDDDEGIDDDAGGDDEDLLF